jgi:hypothetical protein
MSEKTCNTCAYHHNELSAPCPWPSRQDNEYCGNWRVRGGGDSLLRLIHEEIAKMRVVRCECQSWYQGAPVPSNCSRCGGSGYRLGKTPD